MPEHHCTARDIALLRRVERSTWDQFCGDVTWHDEYRRKGAITSYRLWDNETDYTVVTPRVKRLLAMGLVRKFAGYTRSINSGFVDLTDEGKAVLRHLQSSCKDARVRE